MGTFPHGRVSCGLSCTLPPRAGFRVREPAAGVVATAWRGASGAAAEPRSHETTTPTTIDWFAVEVLKPAIQAAGVAGVKA